jgi:hypothetical protein
MPDQRKQGEGAYKAGCEVAKKVGLDVCGELKKPEKESASKSDRSEKKKK